MNLLVAGGAGFIGSNFSRFWLERHPTDRIVTYDLLTYAGNMDNLSSLPASAPSRHQFVHGDICDRALLEQVISRQQIDTVVNFAAESHNSRAIVDPEPFFRTNVLGVQSLLEACRNTETTRVHQVSTCEVFGDLPLDSPLAFSENDPYRPRTPYNASKAAGDLAARSYHQSFGLHVTISICANNYGPRQLPEKVIPLFITRALDNRPLPVYRSSHHLREWLHVDDHCRALEAVLLKGEPGETYNIGSGTEKSVDEIADSVLELVGRPQELKRYVQDRPGHDRRYLLASDKIRRELAWQPLFEFGAGLADTVAWYRAHEDWWRPLLARAHVDEDAWPGPRH